MFRSINRNYKSAFPGGGRCRRRMRRKIRYRFSSLARKSSRKPARNTSVLIKFCKYPSYCIFAIRMQNKIFNWVCFGRFSLREKPYLIRRLIRLRHLPPPGKAWFATRISGSCEPRECANIVFYFLCISLYICFNYYFVSKLRRAYYQRHSIAAWRAWVMSESSMLGTPSFACSGRKGTWMKPIFVSVPR